MADYRRMYTLLFNAFTDAVRLLDKADVRAARVRPCRPALSGRAVGAR